MSGLGEAPPIVVRETRCEPLDAGQVTIRLLGERSEELPATIQLVLVVGTDGDAQRFPAIPQPRQTVGAEAQTFDASFVLPAALVSELRDGLTLYAGELELAVPPPAGVDALAAPAPADPVPDDASIPPVTMVQADVPATGDDPLRAELTARARSEARLRAELAELRARLDARESAGSEVERLTTELAAELEQVRGVVTSEVDRRREVESRSMVLAAELTAAQAERDEAAAAAEALRSEAESLRGQVASLERELQTIEDELARTRASEAGARVAADSVSSELEALRGEVDRLGAERGAEVEATEGVPSELERAQALLAEARSLRSSLD